MKFGVNYTPRRGWFHSWLDFDAEAVRDDFHAIRAIGADHVRIFPLWPLLQPNRTLIRHRAIGDVVRTVEIAGECGLEVTVDVLQGHLSSFDFLPSWVTSWHRRNLFIDPDVVSAQRNLVAEMARALRGIPAAAGVSVGNEFFQFAASRHPFAHEVSEDDAMQWLRGILETAKQEWPHGIHTHSHDDDLWFEDDQPFTPACATTVGDLTTVHSWIFGRIGPRLGKQAPQLVWFARYLCELAAAWSEDPGRGVWLQEIGAPENYVDQDQAPQFLMETLEILMGERGGGVSPGLEAVTWWCSHDVSRELSDFPAIEYSLGLLGQDGNPKPIGEAFHRAAQRWADLRVHGEQRSSLLLTAQEWTRVDTDARHEYFDRWMELALAGDVRCIELDRSRYLPRGDHGNRGKETFLSMWDS